MSQIETLKRIMETNEEELKPILYALGREYLVMAGYSEERINEIYSQLGTSEFWRQEYLDPTGKESGMSTMDAFRCLVDVHRTAVLMKGVKQSVNSLREQMSSEVVGIDAGTGTGILSIALIAAGCDKVYALEINQGTATATAKLMDKLGFAGKIEVITCDATNVRLPALLSKPADILVSENLSAGLFDEPQYEIIGYLSKYLSDSAKIIPFKGINLVGLGTGDWDKLSNKKVTSYITLPELQRLSDNRSFAGIESKRGMGTPTVKGRTTLLLHELSKEVNTLLISSRFHINDEPSSPVLMEDSAMFLGGSYALRLPTPVKPINGLVNIDLEYPAGKRVELTNIDVEDNEIYLR